MSPPCDSYIHPAPVGPDVSGGTYTLLITLAETATVTIGALGPRGLEAGWYAYTGSALGSGGFARVDRHRRLAAGEHDTRHWHVDYLLGHPATAIDGVVTSAAAIECGVARRLCRAHEAVADVGCSDCDCRSHLTFSPDRGALQPSVQSAHRELAS